MYNISSIGRKTVNPYSSLSKSSKVRTANPFFQEDTLSISDDAMILSAALNKAKASLNSEMSKLDSDKISSLKHSIESGNYNVTGEDIAAKLLLN